MGINVVCKTPITALTENSYPLIEKWCSDNEIPYYTGIELMDTYTGKSRKEYLSSEKLRNKFREKSDKEFFEDEEMMKIGYSKKEKKCNFDCSAGKTDIFINSNTQLLPCMKASGVEEWKLDIKTLGIDAAYGALQKKISDVKGKALKYCVGCEHHQVCQECIMTQYEHEDVKKHRWEYCQNLKKFMEKKQIDD